MRKSNTAHSQRGLKRHNKNVQRVKRAKALRDFNHMVAQAKFIQEYMKAREEQKSKLLESSDQ